MEDVYTIDFFSHVFDKSSIQSIQKNQKTNQELFL